MLIYMTVCLAWVTDINIFDNFRYAQGTRNSSSHKDDNISSHETHQPLTTLFT